MKKLILIMIFVIAGAAFTTANAATTKLKVDYSLPISHQNYSVTELLSSKATVEFTSNAKLNAIQKVSTGNVTDGNGNVIGWWAYDNNSGVLLIYLY